MGYDRRRESNFVSSVETTLILTNCPSVHDFYVEYLPRYLAYDDAPPQQYPPDGYEQSFFGVVHWSIMMILEIATDFQHAFAMIQHCEKSLWEEPFAFSFWGRRMDSDRIRLSEWPLVFCGPLPGIFSIPACMSFFRKTQNDLNPS